VCEHNLLLILYKSEFKGHGGRKMKREPASIRGVSGEWEGQELKAARIRHGGDGKIS